MTYRHRPHQLVAAWLRMHLAGARVSKSAAADLIGMPQQTFSRKVNGETPFTIDEMVTIAQRLRIDLATWADGARALDTMIDLHSADPVDPPDTTPTSPETPPISNFLAAVSGD